MHLVLLGDSIFDNRVYVQTGEPDVRQQLADLVKPIPVTLLALDGATTQGIPRQLGKMPADATHLILSVGGNDLLGQYHLLTQATNTIFDAFVARLVENRSTPSSLHHLLSKLSRRGFSSTAT